METRKINDIIQEMKETGDISLIRYAEELENNIQVDKLSLIHI